MDVRYNVIQWVHRLDARWSYGNALSDPRTGEIIQGGCRFGSAGPAGFSDRRGLLAPYEKGSHRQRRLWSRSCSRLRQLAAHESHTLGLQHNFCREHNQPGFVMDYPAPFAARADGVPDISDAYAKGIG